MHLDKLGVKQTVYAPVRTEAEGRWSSPELSNIECHMRHILRLYHRILFRTKIRNVIRDIRLQIELRRIDIIHAHFLYSDGAVALHLKKQLGIPYIVALRNTDINIFMRYRPDLCFIRDEILREASKVIYLTPSYQSIMQGRLNKNDASLLSGKSVVVPNGVGSDWLIDPPQSRYESRTGLSFLYVGNFSKNKNILNLLEAVAIIAAKTPVHLTLVGGGGNGVSEVLQLLASGKYPFAEYVGRVENRDELRKIYRDHDLFVMASFWETFGIVYIEALSQGLPIVHSRGQGVDGYFVPNTIVEAVNPSDPADIAEKIQMLAARLPDIRQDCINEAKRFDWNNIADTYSSLYQSVISLEED